MSDDNLFSCPLCDGIRRWENQRLPDGSSQRRCVGCGYCWHSSEDRIVGVKVPETVIDNAPEICVSLDGKRSINPS